MNFFRKKLNFRNYTPLTTEIQIHSSQLTTDSTDTIRTEITSIEQNVKRFAQDALDVHNDNTTKELDLSNLAVN